MKELHCFSDKLVEYLCFYLTVANLSVASLDSGDAGYIMHVCLK